MVAREEKGRFIAASEVAGLGGLFLFLFGLGLEQIISQQGDKGRGFRRELKQRGRSGGGGAPRCLPLFVCSDDALIYHTVISFVGAVRLALLLSSYSEMLRGLLLMSSAPPSSTRTLLASAENAWRGDRLAR